MGVPAFFRWLSGKYEKILTPVIEQKPVEVDGVKIPLDWTKPNPNGVEYDNIYLDMNGIIHPCCHPEDGPAPTTEDEMIALIFQYMDRLFAIVRPRKLIYMAIDGVAPRAKMNQQRSRRFRTAREAFEKAEEQRLLREEMEQNGLKAPPAKDVEHEFDSNCITPGTEFMSHLSECLRYYIHDRLSSDPGWRNVKVVLSDATVPGEGEHKIIDYIRKQRANPAHDPNTMHCLFGADADLIFLALGTHEPHFHVIREDLVPMNAKPCFLCGQMGHTKDMCTGEAKDPNAPPVYIDKSFVSIRINVLREYLEHDLYVSGLPFPFDVERAMDDWVFICFFVGNDFLPHMPSLEIREGAIDRLVNIWKKNLPLLGGYLTQDGTINCHRVQYLFKDLGQQEDEIFRMRKDEEERQKMRRKRRKTENKSRRENMLRSLQASAEGAREVDQALKWSEKESREQHRTAQSAFERAQSEKAKESKEADPNKAAAAALRMSMSLDGIEGQKQEKRKAPAGDDDEDEEDPPDDVRLWENGWKERYYQTKFDVSCADKIFVNQVAQAYMEGLAWVLAYYYQGCVSWKWYYPYHYSPFASDIANADLVEYVEFEKNTQAFKALEQLMGVLPAASGRRFLPDTWNRLMYSDDSPILDFYPTDFKLDLNGKRFAWMGVALLPFIDEQRLLGALESVYSELTEEQKQRNKLGTDYLFVGQNHAAFNALAVIYELPGNIKAISLNPSQTQGMSGTINKDPFVVMPGSVVPSPLLSVDLPNIRETHAISVQYLNPHYKEGTVFQHKLLKGITMPSRATTREDVESGANGGRQRGPRNMFQQQQQNNQQQNRNNGAADRMIRHGIGMYNAPQGGLLGYGAAPARGGQPAPFVPPGGGYGIPQYGNVQGGYTAYGGGAAAAWQGAGGAYGMMPYVPPTQYGGVASPYGPQGGYGVPQHQHHQQQQPQQQQRGAYGGRPPPHNPQQQQYNNYRR